MSGRVVHFEIPADDVPRAQAFYREAFGWAMNSMPDMGYTMVGTTPTDDRGTPTEPGSINGGMLARQEPISGPVIIVDVDDIDGALKRIEDLGGKVLRDKRPVADMGFAAYFADSEGNVIGLWQGAP
jgi:predicted enzyme related to lactoylglutathione lyase